MHHRPVDPWWTFCSADLVVALVFVAALLGLGLSAHALEQLAHA